MKKMKGLKSLKSKAGFSLVECLVAILVFTIMSLIVATILNAAITSHRSNMEETRSLKNQREALREGDVVAREAVGAFAPVQFNFEAPGVAGALPMPNVEYHFRNEVSEIDGDRVDGLEVSQIRAADSSSGGMNFPQMELASNLLGAGGVPLVDVVLSSPAANSFPWSGASGGPVRSGTDASGNGLGSTYQLATGEFAHVLRVSVPNSSDKRSPAEKEDATQIGLNISASGVVPLRIITSGSVDVKLYGPVSDPPNSNVVSNISPITGEELTDYYQIVLEKIATPGSPFVPDFDFAIVTANVDPTDPDIDNQIGFSGIPRWMNLS